MKRVTSTFSIIKRSPENREPSMHIADWISDDSQNITVLSITWRMVTFYLIAPHVEGTRTKRVSFFNETYVNTVQPSSRRANSQPPLQRSVTSSTQHPRADTTAVSVRAAVTVWSSIEQESIVYFGSMDVNFR